MKVKLAEIIKPQKKGNHHFVPQLYIKRFYDDDIQKVWRGHLKYKNIKEFPSAAIFYHHELYDLKVFKERFNEIEDHYSRLENLIADTFKLLDDIKNLGDLDKDKQLNLNFFFIIKTIILMQYFRTKDIQPELFKESCSNLVKIYEEKENFLRKKFPFIKIEQLRKFEKLIKRGIAKNKKYTNEVIKGLQHSILPILLSDLSKGGIKITRIKTKKYISSDKPVACTNINDLLNFRNFLYPLSPNILISALGDDVTEDMIKDEDKVNEFISKNAISFIISHDKKLIENILSK